MELLKFKVQTTPQQAEHLQILLGLLGVYFIPRGHTFATASVEEYPVFAIDESLQKIKQLDNYRTPGPTGFQLLHFHEACALLRNRLLYFWVQVTPKQQAELVAEMRRLKVRALGSLRWDRDALNVWGSETRHLSFNTLWAQVARDSGYSKRGPLQLLHFHEALKLLKSLPAPLD